MRRHVCIVAEEYRMVGMLAGKIFLPKLNTPTHISLESLYKAGHNEIVNGAIKHL